jgi:hypothetical protein
MTDEDAQKILDEAGIDAERELARAMKLVEAAETRAKEKAMREAIEREAAEIRLALLSELADMSLGGAVVGTEQQHRLRQIDDIERRARILNQLDPNGGGFGVLSSVSAGAGTEPAMAEEPNREFVRACLRFRDDGRDWSGDILLETGDGEVKRAVCAGLGGETTLVRLDGVERMVEFSRFTGECIDAAYMGKLRIASAELYRVHPETYRVRERAGIEVAQLRSRIREAERGEERRLSWVVAHQGANPPAEGSVG